MQLPLWMVVLPMVLVTQCSLSLESLQVEHAHTNAVVEVTKIYDNVGDVIRVTGVSESINHIINSTELLVLRLDLLPPYLLSAASSIASSICNYHETTWCWCQLLHLMHISI